MHTMLFEKPISDIARLFRIVSIVQERQRNMPPERGVLPVTVQAFINEYRAEQTLRRDMSLLWQAGYLERVGGKEGCRRGYRVGEWAQPQVAAPYRVSAWSPLMLLGGA